MREVHGGNTDSGDLPSGMPAGNKTLTFCDA